LDKVAKFGVIDEASTYASITFAKGPALGVMKVGNPTYALVHTCDRTGGRRKEGGSEVSVEPSHPEAFENLEVEDLKDGRYKIKFVPKAEGSFTMNIVIKNPDNSFEAIAGSPFQLTVRMPTEYAAIASAPEHVEGRLKFGETGEAHFPDKMGAFHHPAGVDFDGSGQFVFVVDQGNHRVQAFDTTDQQPLAEFGKKGFTSLDFDTPCDLVVDRENHVVVTDLLNHRLQVLEFSLKTRDFRFIRSIGHNGTGPGQFQFPKRLCFADTGHVLVCDSGNHRVQVLDATDGFKFVREFGKLGEGEGEFMTPLDVVVNSDGEILVSDSNNRIQVFNTEGVFLRAFVFGKKPKDGALNYPTNMVVNDENALFICDQGNHRVQVLSAKDGTPLHRFGGAKKKKAEGEEEPPAEEEDADKPPEWSGIKKPSGISVNTHGMVVVADTYHNTLFAF